MPIQLLRKRFRAYFLIVLSSVFLLGALPYFAGSGLDDPEPIGAYLNGNFPSSLPQGTPYEPVFPNLTFDSPLTFNEVPGQNKIIVGQRDGRIFWFDKTPNVSAKNSMLDLSEKVGVVWDGGFLGLTLHPQFGTNGKNYFYVWYTTEDANSNDFPNSYTTQSCDSEEYWGNFLILARYEANPTTLSVQESSEQVLLKLRMYGTTHRGGGLLFGDDGFLYLTTGDQTAFKKSQDIVNNLDGGVLRLDVDQDPTKSHPPVRTMPNDHGFSDEITGNGYWIPNDNPFLSPSGDNFEEYYSLGHRNPHRMTKDRLTGKLYVGEIGGGRHEEINIINKGKNYGWPLYEGLYYSTFCVENLYNDMSHEQPLVAFPRAQANAIIGGFVYRGNEIPELEGKYVCADYGSGEEIFIVDVNTGAYQQYGNFTSTNIISFGEDEQGELYILKQGTSTLFKMKSKNSGFGGTPQLLSETGAFSDLSTLTPSSGLIPYDLVESFWSDGALKSRWMAIPNDGSHDTNEEKIVYSDIDDWNFPVGSVLVKHFELPIDERDPSITKKLETRFSVKASDGNFYFVTYKWNEQQTEAQLLTAGLEESVDITKLDGSPSTQNWSYPSTIDCVSCHNPVTGGTLGTRARYLNKDFTYNQTGRTGNQLVTLSHLGILDENITDANTDFILTSKATNDPTASLEEKARSYLDLNCAYCHRPGTGNRGDFDLRLNLETIQTGILSASPYLTLGIPDEKIVDPGSTSTSILYHRLNSTDPIIKMPPIAKNKIDDGAVQLIGDWINQLNPDPCADRIIMETFNNVPGTSIAELKSQPNFPASPDATTELDQFRIPINVADDYGVRVKGLLKAPETGTYYFWITGDDNVELNLSTDADEANKTRIAYHNSWSRDGEWNKFPTQKSAAINLVAGQNYYIEGLMNERGGGDNLSVGWRKPSNGNGTVPFQVIPCTSFDYFNGPPIIDVTGVSIDPTTLTLIEEETANLTATVLPSDATDKSVSWLSGDDTIATVDANGLVTAIAEGTVTVTATTNDGGFTAQATVNVTPANPDPCTASGTILMQRYDGIPGSLITNLTGAPEYPDSPSVSSQLSLFEIQSNQGDNYGVRVSGYICAPETGTYYFWIAGNNHTQLNLSTTANEADKATIAHHEDWAGNRVWDKFPTQKSQGIALTQGEEYYIEALMKEEAFGDNLAVGWRRPSEGNGNLPSEVIPGNVLSPFVPQAVAVTGVNIEPTTIDIPESATGALTATVLPSDATDKSVSWLSGDDTIATVDANGLVTAIAEGTVTVTATTNDGGFTAQATVNVTPANPDPCTASGTILMQRYDGIPGSLITNLTGAPEYPDSPSVSSQLSLFEIQSNQGDNYGVRVSGYICAPETGTYYFWIAGNNHTQLNLSTTANEADKATIAHHEDWAGNRVWDKFPTQKSQGIALTQGEEYYIEALMKEEAFGDNLAVGWRRPSEGNGNLPSEVIPGNVLSPFVPQAVAVTGVNIEPTTIDIPESATGALTATVLPSDATDKSVSWLSGDDTIATVDANGLVTAIAEGTVTVTATTNDGGFTAQATVNVTPANPDPCTASGTILMQRYDGIPGSLITNLTGAPEYPDSPSVSSQLSLFEIQSNQGDNYGVRVSGYICAPETGTYYFWIAGNNHTQLNLSTTANEADKATIAHHEDWAGNRVWDKFPTQKSQGIALTQGEEYYIEALMKEEAFGDNLAVGWRRPSEGNGNLPSEVIPGNVLSPALVNPNPLKGSIQTSFDLTIYPNPASNVLKILFSKSATTRIEHVYVYDALGRNILNLRENEMPLNHNSYEIELFGFSPGLHFLYIEMNDGQLITKKFIKE